MISILVLNHLSTEDYLWRALFPLLFLSNDTHVYILEEFDLHFSENKLIVVKVYKV